MKFHVKSSPLGRPFLWGKSEDKNLDHYVKSSCHEFFVESVDMQEKFLVYNSSFRSVFEVPSSVTYVAGKYPEGSLHGPASSIVTKSIIYPCEEFRCRLDCPCHLCRKKASNCLKAATNSSIACGDCSDCSLDYNDHLLHHRARHLLCKYCENLHEIFPQYSYTVLYETKYDEGPKPFKAFIHKHVWDDRFQKSGDDDCGLFMCDNCASIFKRKADLRRHEISQHFEFKHSCDVCGSKFTRLESLLLHLRNIHDNNEKTFQCDKCEETFNKKANFIRHIDSRDKNGCNVCGAEFCTRRKLLKHAQIHTTYECVHCNKTFSKKQSLTMHLAKREEKLCSECGKRLCNMSDLNSHCFNHRYTPCEICGNNYLGTSLMDHKLMNHAHGSFNS